MGTPRTSQHAAHGLATEEDLELTAEAAMSRIGGWITVSSILSLAGAFADALALGGLAARLTKGLDVGNDLFLGSDVITTYPAIIVFIGLSLVISLVNTTIRERTTAQWDADRRRDLVQAYRRADFPVQISYSGAGLTSAVEQIGKANTQIGATVGMINTAVRTLVYVGFAFAISWRVSLVVIAAGGTLTVCLRQITRRTRRMHRDMAGRFIVVGEEIGDMAASARELHTLNRWDETEQFLGGEISTLQRLRFVSSTLAAMVGPIYWVGTLLVGVAVSAFSSSVVGGNTATSGLAASGILLLRSLTSAQNAQSMYQQYNDARPYGERVRVTLAKLRRAERRSTDTSAMAGRLVRIDGASLGYSGEVIVADLDLELEGPGGIAIVGPSGSGKSTTLLSLAGLIPPSAGSISVDGVELAGMEGAALGATVSLLPQDPKLLRGSLRSNLLRPEAERSDSELWDALTAVNLTETVKGFDGGLDAEMGRAAEGFSGGELQRLGLARLLVNRPSVWLVDEPTSALDRENSARVLELLSAAMDEHLVVVVTHRPELLHRCKRVIYMDTGAVLDDGTLAEVVSRQPFVAAMVAEPAAAS